MMLKFKVIGTGAAGNKAVATLVEKGFNPKDVLLINTTNRDIPESLLDRSQVITGGLKTLGGCGKEREIGRKIILNELSSKDNSSLDLDHLADSDTNAFVVVSSTEGGTGSATTPIIAKYIREVLGYPVIVVLFFGFNTDVRGMQNSIEICQELADEYGVIGISNEKYLDDDSKNLIKAEKAANERFVSILRTLSGDEIVPGTQNIDTTDLFKLISTPGYMVVETCDIQKIKNVEQHNKAINSAIDNSKLLDHIPGAKRIGIIYDIPDSLSEFVDYSAGSITASYGIPYEIFSHIQSTCPGKITWIVSGLPMPLKVVEEIYENYKKRTDEVNKSRDSFFDSVNQFKGESQDSMFDMLGGSNSTKSKSNFFSEFGIKTPEPKITTKSEKVVTVTKNGSNQ